MGLIANSTNRGNANIFTQLPSTPQSYAKIKPIAKCTPKDYANLAILK